MFNIQEKNFFYRVWTKSENIIMVKRKFQLTTLFMLHNKHGLLSLKLLKYFCFNLLILVLDDPYTRSRTKNDHHRVFLNFTRKFILICSRMRLNGLSNTFRIKVVLSRFLTVKYIFS